VLSRLKAMSPGPQAIYFGGVVTEAALLRLQMSEMGINDVLYAGVTGFDSETFNKTAGNAAEGTLIIGKKSIGEDSRFVEDYKKAGYKEYYEATGPFAYDATNMIIAAINKVGPNDKALLAKTIRGTDYDGILGPTRFDEFGQTKTGGLMIKVSQGGKWTQWESSAYAGGTRVLPKK
jgi:branched-chain amino acid transport system substrate-binding protein